MQTQEFSGRVILTKLKVTSGPVRGREREGKAGAVAALPTAAVRVGQPKMVDDDDDVRGGVSQVAFCQIFIRRRCHRLLPLLPPSLFRLFFFDFVFTTFI